MSEHALILEQKTVEHVMLTGMALAIASLIAIPLGVLIVRETRLEKVVLSAGSIMQTIPCLAMLAFLVPILGLGTTPTLIVLTFYALYPILRSTYTGLKNVPQECIEAARGLGFSNFQRLRLVELPLAFPVIISGIRVATSMTIGITTIAAFIGAGGLGDFITQGLALNNTSLILLGAIPIAILALVFDYGISQIEVWLQRQKENPSKFQRGKQWVLGGGSLLLVAMLGNFILSHIYGEKKDSIVIASKNFTEQYILSELMAQVIEAKTPYKVTRKFNLGATDIVHQALLKGNVDLYPEYSGTAYLTVLKKAPVEGGNVLSEVRENYRREYDLDWLEPFGFSNAEALAVQADVAQAYGLKSYSDLAKVASNMTIATTPEFLKREDMMPSLKSNYGFIFKAVMQVDPNLSYTAISNKKVEIISSYTTDGRLKKYNLVALEDDKGKGPSYVAAPVIRCPILKSHPEVYEALALLFGRIDQEKMMNLNYLVDVEGLAPAVVARQFLRDIL